MSASAPAELNTGSNKQFKLEEIGFFDPELGLERRSCNEACYKDNRLEIFYSQFLLSLDKIHFSVTAISEYRDRE